VRVIDLGRLSYSQGNDRMVSVLTDRIAGRCEDTLLLCEHDPVFTLGTERDAPANLLDPGDVPVMTVRRGGNVTYHGPGQLVGYPILALPEHRHDLHGYLRGLEQVLIDTLSDLGLAGTRDERNTGVWVDGQKIAAIGIACRRWVTWHGFALNLTTDMSPYQRINPCGLETGLVTRLADHLDPCPSMAEIAQRVEEHLRTWWTDWSGQAAG